MEEDKAAAYYDELSRKGEGAAKFKQGLGFSSSDIKKTSSKPSLFSNFVRASSPRTTLEEDEPHNNNNKNKKDHAHVLDSIHNKLKRSSNRHRSPSDDDIDRRRERRERYDDREREEKDNKYSRKSEYRERRRRRSRSYSPPRVSRIRDRDRDRDRDRRRERDSGSNRSSCSKSDRGVDYSKLIQGYSQMTPAERVKAKMKLQLSQTVAKDETMDMGTGWERFDFNKDAPLDDDDEELEVAEDDISVVKDIGRSFRFSAVEARREEEVRAAHDQAMFGGAPAASLLALPPEATGSSKEGEENDRTVSNGENHLTSGALMSDKVISMQQGSWRDRARRFQNGPEKN